MTNRTEDIEVTWARRQETIRGILKHIRVMVEASQTHATQAQRHCGISATQLWALCELGRTPGLRTIDLAKAMAIQAPAARTLLHDLEEQGLVFSVSAGEGPNSARMSLTEAGRERVDQFPGDPRGVVISAVEKLDDHGLHTLRQALQGLLDGMPSTDGAAAFTPLGDMMRGIAPSTARQTDRYEHVNGGRA